VQEKFIVFAGRDAKVCRDNPLLPCERRYARPDITRRRAPGESFARQRAQVRRFRGEPGACAVDLRKIREDIGQALISGGLANSRAGRSTTGRTRRSTCAAVSGGIFEEIGGGRDADGGFGHLRGDFASAGGVLRCQDDLEIGEQ
jgi:hypothetical protein